MMVSVAGHPPSLAAVITYNNDVLVPAYERLHRLNQRMQNATRRATQLFAGVRTLHELVQLFTRYAPERRVGYANDLMNETVDFYARTRQVLEAYPMADVTHPTLAAERESAAHAALAALEPHAQMPELEEFFGGTAPELAALQMDMRDYLETGVLAIIEELAPTSRVDDTLDLIQGSLRAWYAGPQPVDFAGNVCDLLLAAGDLISATMGNMPDYGDSLAVGLLKWDVYSTMLAAASERDAEFQRGVRYLGRAARLEPEQVAELETHLRAGEYRQARDLVDARFQTDVASSAGLTVLSGLQLLGALVELWHRAPTVCDPDEASLRDWVETGRALTDVVVGAASTAVDFAVTIERGIVQLGEVSAVIRTFPELAASLGRAVATWGPRLNVFAAGAGVIFGSIDLFEGLREGDSERALLGGLNLTAGALIGIATVGEMMGYSAAVAWAGPAGAVVGAAGAVVALCYILQELLPRFPGIDTDHSKRAVLSVIGALLGEGPGDRALCADGELVAPALTTEAPDGESGEPRIDPAASRPIIDVVDREAGVAFRAHLERIRGIAEGLTFSPIMAPDHASGAPITRRLRSLGFTAARARTLVHVPEPEHHLDISELVF